MSNRDNNPKNKEDLLLEEEMSQLKLEDEDLMAIKLSPTEEDDSEDDIVKEDKKRKTIAFGRKKDDAPVSNTATTQEEEKEEAAPEKAQMGRSVRQFSVDELDQLDSAVVEDLKENEFEELKRLASKTVPTAAKAATEAVTKKEQSKEKPAQQKKKDATQVASSNSTVSDFPLDELGEVTPKNNEELINISLDDTPSTPLAKKEEEKTTNKVVTGMPNEELDNILLDEEHYNPSHKIETIDIEDFSLSQDDIAKDIALLHEKEDTSKKAQATNKSKQSKKAVKKEDTTTSTKPTKKKSPPRKKESPAYSTSPASANFTTLEEKEKIDFLLKNKQWLHSNDFGNMLLALDELISHVPHEKLTEFARSEHFNTYALVIEEIQENLSKK